MKTNKVKGSKKLILLMLFLVGLAASITAGAYWAGALSVVSITPEEETVKIGEGKDVVTKIVITKSPSSTLDLVPVGREVEGESVSSITYTFAVEWAGTEDASATGAKADLTVTPTLSGLGVTELGLFTVTAETTQNVTFGSTTVITITITFTTEPSNKAQYDLVVNATLTLTTTFSLGTITPN